MNPKVLFVADQFDDSFRDDLSRYPGGAELTDAAVIEACPWPLEKAKLSELRPAQLTQADICIVGNAATADSSQLELLKQHPKLILFEHDLRICKYRANFDGHWFHQLFNRCICRQQSQLHLVNSAAGLVFLTEMQRKHYKKNPFFRGKNQHVLGSSVFSQRFFDRVQRHARDPVIKDVEVAVLYSRHPCKGFETSYHFAKRFSTEPFVIKDLKPDEVLDIFARSKRFVYLPTFRESASRVVVEARFLGCEVHANNRIGVMGQPWWQLQDAEALRVVKDMPHRFWSLVREILIR